MDTIKVGPYGKSSGQAWDGNGHGNIVQIFVRHGDTMINSIQYQYADVNGKLKLSELHGSFKIGNKFDVVQLNYPKEYITWIRGYTKWNYGCLCSITFGTNLGEYGPFGTILGEYGTQGIYRDNEFIIKLGENRQFFEFHGFIYDNCVTSIGVYLKLKMNLDLVKKETED